jgi:hypothetical protein
LGSYVAFSNRPPGLVTISQRFDDPSLRWWPNRIPCCTWATPGQVTPPRGSALAMTSTGATQIERVSPAQPFPKPEQFADVLAALAQPNEKARSIDLSRVLDQSLVQSAIDRGLDKVQAS